MLIVVYKPIGYWLPHPCDQIEPTTPLPTHLKQTHPCTLIVLPTTIPTTLSLHPSQQTTYRPNLIQVSQLNPHLSQHTISPPFLFSSPTNQTPLPPFLSMFLSCSSLCFWLPPSLTNTPPLLGIPIEPATSGRIPCGPRLEGSKHPTTSG